MTEEVENGLMATVAADTTSSETATVDTTSSVETGNAKPEWLADDKFYDPEKGVKADEIYKAFQAADKQAKDFRRIISKGLPEAPESVDGYKFEHETYKDLIPEDDIAIKAVKNIFHKRGLPNDVFNETVSGVLDAMAEAGLIQQPLSKEEQSARQTEREQAFVKEQMAKLGDNGEKLVQQVAQWGKTLQERGQLSEAELKAFFDVGYSAEGVLLLNKLRTMTGEKQIPVGDVQVEGLPSVQEWQAMHDMSKMQDPNYREKVFKIGEQLKKRGLI